MRFSRLTSILATGGILAACATHQVPGADKTASVSSTGSFGCDYLAIEEIPPRFLTVPRHRFANKCMAPRPSGENDPREVVLIPRSAAEFVSKCAVQLKVDYVPEGHDCYMPDEKQPLKRNDKVLITHWGEDDYALIHKDGNLFVSLKASRTRGGGVPYLIGENDGLTFAVYIEYDENAGDPLNKFYRLEVFNSSEACSDHIPSEHSPIVNCSSSAISTMQESSTSNGGEPPPHD